MAESIRYLDPDTLIALQSRLIDDYGGLHGLRDRGLLESAAARPVNKGAYGADFESQAAALMFGLAKNHAFLDGNKRIALAATTMMLLANRYRFTCDPDTIAAFLENCSDPTWTEDAVEVFVRRHATRLTGA